MRYTRMKQIAVDIMDIALDTGYDVDFLGSCVDELVADGESYEDAVQQVREIAEEQDY